MSFLRVREFADQSALRSLAIALLKATSSGGTAGRGARDEGFPMEDMV